VVLIGAVLAGGEVCAEDNADDSSTKIKNVLFIISDDLKASVLNCYGDEVCQTPNIDKLAETGVVFNRAYAQGSFCVPSRPSFMFSRYSQAAINTSVHKAFPQVLKEKGYYSARVGKVFHMAVPNDIVDGTDGHEYPDTWTEKFNCTGKETYTPGAYEGLNLNIFQTEMEGRSGAGTPDRMFAAVQMDGDGSCQPDYKVAEKTIELLREHKDDPFVICAGFVRPHYPMVAPKKYFDMYPWQDIELPKRVEGDWDDIPKQGIPSKNKTSEACGIDKYPDNQKRMWAAYYATITFMDDQLGKILDELERLGLKENTAIIFTSDHGYHLGEHDFWMKMNLHEEVTRVPLIVNAPGIQAGQSDSLVELVDISPTFLELVGQEVPDYCHGLSMVPILRNPDARIRDYAFSYHGGKDPKQFAVRGDKWAFIQYKPGIEELYDMDKDPGQFTNLAKTPEYKAEIKKLSKVVQQKVKIMKDEI
jgi:iduronate 2-sulfatase